MYSTSATSGKQAGLQLSWSLTFKDFQSLYVFSFHILSLSLYFRCLYVFSFHILSSSLYFRCLYVFSFHVFCFRCLCLLILSLLVFSGFIVSYFKQYSFTIVLPRVIRSVSVW